jgi:hypothetical protein
VHLEQRCECSTFEVIDPPLTLMLVRDVIPVFEDKDGEWGVPDREQNGTGVLQRWYNVVEPLFALLALASLTLQAIKSTRTPNNVIHITCRAHSVSLSLLSVVLNRSCSSLRGRHHNRIWL